MIRRSSGYIGKVDAPKGKIVEERWMWAFKSNEDAMQLSIFLSAKIEMLGNQYAVGESFAHQMPPFFLWPKYHRHTCHACRSFLNFSEHY